MRRTMLVNQVQGLVGVVFSEFLVVMKDIETKTAQYLLNYYPRPQDIVELGRDGLSETFGEGKSGENGKGASRGTV